ncbi:MULTISPECIES: hypothetical protein [Streptomyces violaceusniger group]|uniref:Uncharacterized protein n=2 Tax=Streptomyces rhizosphaericus TaxID=114699 RepID=A0ABN1QG17_9ACTN|nr:MULTISPECIES: hypothetical protein [Streptomyces violaceusniger group]
MQHMPARGGEHHVQARRRAEDGQLTGGGNVAALVSEAASMLLASADGAGPPTAARVRQGAATSTAGAALLDLEDPLSPSGPPVQDPRVWNAAATPRRRSACDNRHPRLS